MIAPVDVIGKLTGRMDHKLRQRNINADREYKVKVGSMMQVDEIFMC